MSRFNRRDFLRLSSLVSTGATLYPILSRLHPIEQTGMQRPSNIIIILFDAMSARNLSVYGYQRDTTPQLQRFAERAIVYHSHYSAGNFTTPGTTSFLTGLYPWTHRAIDDGGLMARELTGENIFKMAGAQYNRLAWGQNVWANYILDQFQNDIDDRLHPDAFSLNQAITGEWFKNDVQAGYRSFDNFLFRVDNPPASLLLGTLRRLIYLRSASLLTNRNSVSLPRGFPELTNYPMMYRLQDVFDGVTSTITNFETSTFAYFHFWAPHEPYRPDKNFDMKFMDKYQPMPKPLHPLSRNRDQNRLNVFRRRYDEYVANVDFEFGRMVNTLERSGILDESIVIITSDHGEMFERGEAGHSTPLMYDPVLHIPLLISLPKQRTRQDIYEPTNAVDVLPTLLHLTGQSIPSWCEGKLLPALGGQYDPQRSTFSIEAKRNPAFAPLRIATIAMRKGPHKMIYYTGYGAKDEFELYNLDTDIEEMHNLVRSEPVIAAQMKKELLTRLQEANAHFQAG